MNQKNKFSFMVIMALLALMTGLQLRAQDSAAAPAMQLAISYFLSDVNTPYVKVQTRIKEGKKFLPVSQIPVNVYLGAAEEHNLAGKVVTNDEGFAFLSVPTSLKSAWDSAASVDFTAVSVATKEHPSVTESATITKARLTIDTSNVDGTRNILVTCLEKSASGWTPVKDVELKVVVHRSLGDLPISDEESYTTDSLGQVVAEFKRNELNGDAKGDLYVMAKVEDNDAYGNLAIGKTLNWGRKFVPENTFNVRTLFATRSKAPLWLIFLASSIILAVWGVIIYLGTQLVKIIKLGSKSI